jgi:NADP-dependent 3-hydroxy acid dehydrogenase YdfG
VADPLAHRTFDVNVISHFNTLKTFLPDMIKNNAGHIVGVLWSCGEKLGVLICVTNRSPLRL